MEAGGDFVMDELIKRLRSVEHLEPDEISGEFARESILDAADCIEQLDDLMARAYLRLQCADVPRDPWHWEVSKMLGPTSESSNG